MPHNGFKVEVSKGIILHLVDEVSSWLPGDRIVVASTDYSMHQAEEFNLLPCPECKSNQVKIDGMKYFYQATYSFAVNIYIVLSFTFYIDLSF